MRIPRGPPRRVRRTAPCRGRSSPVRDAGDIDQHRPELHGERQHQEPVGDRAAERFPPRPGRVDVDSLVVVRGVGEEVHAILRDLEPFGVAEVGCRRVLRRRRSRRWWSCHAFLESAESQRRRAALSLRMPGITSASGPRRSRHPHPSGRECGAGSRNRKRTRFSGTKLRRARAPRGCIRAPARQVDPRVVLVRGDESASSCHGTEGWA